MSKGWEYEENKLTVGIYLGLKYCCISSHEGPMKKTFLVSEINDNPYIPCCVSFSQMDETGVVVGFPAKNDIKMEYVVYDVRNIIGRNSEEIKVDENWPFKVENENEKPCIYVNNQLTVKWRDLNQKKLQELF